MVTRQEAINFCMKFDDVYEDYPFRDVNWTVMRHKSNNKVFAWIFERHDHIWINVKCDPDLVYFWRDAYQSVVPAYHLNKEHWNSIILDGGVPNDEIEVMIEDSYNLTNRRK